MAFNSVGPIGQQRGTAEGPGSNKLSAVTKIQVYGKDYINGIKLYWGSQTLMYGSTNNYQPETLDLQDDPISEIRYFKDTAGNLRGLKFKTRSGKTLSVGFLDDTNPAAFDNADNVFTDLITYKGTVNGTTVIWGASFFYTGTSKLVARSDKAVFLWPAVATLAHCYVVGLSYQRVGGLRYQLNVKPPSCDPPSGTSPEQAQLWYRTFRAQENCKETLLLYLPSILIASMMGYEAIGKWAPRTVGGLALIGAFFRYKYLNAYIEDADKRGPPFRHALISMRLVFFGAVAACGYLIGKELYCCWKCCSCSCGKKKEEAEE